MDAKFEIFSSRLGEKKPTYANEDKEMVIKDNG